MRPHPPDREAGGSPPRSGGFGKAPSATRDVGERDPIRLVRGEFAGIERVEQRRGLVGPPDSSSATARPRCAPTLGTCATSRAYSAAIDAHGVCP